MSRQAHGSAGPYDFAFIIHPIDPKADVKRKYPLLGAVLPVPAIHFFSQFFPPVFISRIEGIRSERTGRTVGGWFVACPLTPEMMMSLSVERVYRKIIQAGRLAERLGAKLLGLGAFTSVVGDAGITISRHLSIPVTTGDSYTIAVALEALREGARRMDIEPAGAIAAVVGATGAIGRAAAHLLAGEVRELVLIGRDAARVDALLEALRPIAHARLSGSTRLEDVAKADLVLTVSSAIGAIIEPHHLRSGAVVCDIARPRDVSARVAQERDDVLVIDGGVVQVPGEVDFGFDFGFPPGTAYACMAEVMILCLEGRLESYTLGREITVEQVRAIAELGRRHGFRLAGLRAFDRPLTEEQIARVRARRRRQSPVPMP